MMLSQLSPETMTKEGLKLKNMTKMLRIAASDGVAVAKHILLIQPRLSF